MKNDVTYLGKIITVNSEQVEVEIAESVLSSSPVINGKVYKVGQIGSFVKVIAGNIITYGMVTAVSNSIRNEQESMTNNLGGRFLTINLFGEKVGNSKFEKGIGIFPTINDEVHVVTSTDLKYLYDDNDNGTIKFGNHSSFDDIPVNLNLHKLISRHSAILGSTGSGKSNSVVSIIKSIVNSKQNSRVILIDPHGEYSSAFPEAKVFKVNDEKNPLVIPFWLMNFEELAYFLVGATSLDENKADYRKFRNTIVDLKKKNFKLKSGNIDVNFITEDSPIPFNIRELWFDFNWWINATFSESSEQSQTKDTAKEVEEGDASNLTPAKFEPYANGSGAPYKSKHQMMYPYEKKLYSKLKDSRYDFLFNPKDYNDANDNKDLHNLLQDWIGDESRLTILDMSNVPFELVDICVGLVSRFVYDSMFWGSEESYTGRNRPILLAYEEAHSYLGKNNNSKYSKQIVERIFKEGRKFGVGAMVISQRPSELSDTILAQTGTFINLRLTNSADKTIIKSLAPDNMSSIMNLLSSLRIGEAIVVGEAIGLPSRIKVKLQEPRPFSDDPDIINSWIKKFEFDNEYYKSVVKKMRERKK